MSELSYEYLTCLVVSFWMCEVKIHTFTIYVYIFEWISLYLVYIYVCMQIYEYFLIYHIFLFLYFILSYLWQYFNYMFFFTKIGFFSLCLQCSKQFCIIILFFVIFFYYSFFLYFLEFCRFVTWSTQNIYLEPETLNKN